MKKALVVGIDHYQRSPLHSCVKDASAVAQLLESNGDGSPNFSVFPLTSDTAAVTSAALSAAVSKLFSGDADTALLYFAGHGIVNPETNTGYLVSQDGSRGAWGLSLSEVLGLANAAHPRIKSSVIILDSCHSGYAGEIAGLPPGGAVIGTGVTILSASQRDDAAAEGDEHGLFTEILLDGLAGGSADISGNITPASLYSHVDQTLGPWEQRPVYKANVQSFVTLRQVAPKVPKDALRRLPSYFPDRAYVLPLDPSYESDRTNASPEIQAIPVDPANAVAFKELQQMNRHGLVVPVDAEHMYYVAMKSKGCRLTAIGAHYRKLAEMKRIF